MCDRQTSDRQIIRTIRTRGVLRQASSWRWPSAFWVGLPPSPGPGAESGGQQVGSDNYEKMWKQTFSEEQWLQMLRQRVHQPMAVW